MNLRRRRFSTLVDINVIPLIDVMFMLVIFFVVSTTFQKRAQIDITLPEASAEVADPEVDLIEVSVDAKGTVYVGGQALVNSQVMTIREALRDASLDMKDPPIVISADAEVSHQAVIKVMDAARQVGLVHVTFAIKKLEDEPSD